MQRIPALQLTSASISGTIGLLVCDGPPAGPLELGPLGPLLLPRAAKAVEAEAAPMVRASAIAMERVT